MCYEGKMDDKVQGAYSKELQEFALSLHNVSPAGYRFDRKSLDDILSDKSTLQRWMRIKLMVLLVLLSRP